MKFADLGLSPEVLGAVADLGYETPTPIQAQAIPTILMGRDVLGCAQTGTGKTAAFVLPMIDILSHGRAKARMPRSLILEPTRELATQVSESFDRYGKNCELNMALLIGGESFSDQERKLDRGVDVLIATPGRLIDLFERGKILMNDVKTLVIDEADRMLDMGFIPDVERIVSLLSKIRQTLLFSATMAPEVRRLADAFLINPKEITVAPPATTATNVTQGLAVVDELDKRDALRRLIGSENVTNALIFCNRKKDVDILFRSLTQHGFDAVQLHGDMPQSKRTETLEKFKKNEARLMVCSDVAARGLDIAGLSHVFNFDVPHHAEDYVHRIGRTGRAGREGRAFTFATPEDGKAVAAIAKLIGQEIPVITIEGITTQVLSEESGSRRGRGRGRPGSKATSESHGGESRSRGSSAGRGRSRSGGRGRGEAVVDGAGANAGVPASGAPRHPQDIPETVTAAPEIAAPEITAPEITVEAAPEIASVPPASPEAAPVSRPSRHGRRSSAPQGEAAIMDETGGDRGRRRHSSRDDHEDRGSHPDSVGGPFGDHTPEFFARELRRHEQMERRLAK